MTDAVEQYVPEPEYAEDGFDDNSRNFEDQESESTLEEDLAFIAESIDGQPEGVRNLFAKGREDFCRKEVIDGKTFLLTKRDDAKKFVYALVSEDGISWHARAFRYSRSDDQWKALPGYRQDGSYLKGEEESPLHHYVQSAKLHKDVYCAIESLPEGALSAYAEDFLPGGSGEEGRWDEYAFHEEYHFVRDFDWLEYQTFCQQADLLFHKLSLPWRIDIDVTLEGGLYQMCKEIDAPEFHEIVEAIERLNTNAPSGCNLKELEFSSIKYDKSDPELIQFAEAYLDNTGEFLERMFRTKMPESLRVDFSEERIIDSYEKKSGSKNTTHVEEFAVRSPGGDNLIFAMAFDDLGRVFIDNIYNKDAQVNSYGTLDEITQMGHLVYKPEDYNMQTVCIPGSYKARANGPYTDISRFWLNIPLIKEYEQSLIKRNIGPVVVRSVKNIKDIEKEYYDSRAQGIRKILNPEHKLSPTTQAMFQSIFQ